MTHLRIELNTGLTEEVDSSLIAKLYECVINGELDNASDLKGRLHSLTGYAIHVNYLNEAFDELTITVDNKYVWFEDPVVRLKLATDVGDGTGITETQVSTLSQFPSIDYWKTSGIETFDEFSKFTNITKIDNEQKRFANCTALRSIDLANITLLSGANGYLRYGFEDCTALLTVKNTQNITYLGYGAFTGCTALTTLNLPNVTVIKAESLTNCRNLTTAGLDLSKITEIGENAFWHCEKLEDLETINMPNLQGTLYGCFRYCDKIKHVVNLGNVTTMTSSWGDDGVFNSCPNLEDVVLPETLTAIGVLCFDRVNTKLKWIKIMANAVPTYKLTNGFGLTALFSTAFGELYGGYSDVTSTYVGATYPIYVKDELLTAYQAADGWKYVGPGRLRPLSLFATDFPNE